MRLCSDRLRSYFYRVSHPYGVLAGVQYIGRQPGRLFYIHAQSPYPSVQSLWLSGAHTGIMNIREGISEENIPSPHLD